MLHPAENQVAGYHGGGGHLVPLVDKAGRFYKPLQDKGRGPNEINFYQKFWADQDIPPRVQDFFPRFYGTDFLEASDGSGPHEHAIIEDLTHHFHWPSVIDIKVGSRTWYPEASEQYIKKCLEKDKETTSLFLGFRISGMQVYEDATKTNWKPDKKWCKLLNVERVKLALKRFVSLNPSSDTDPDGALAPVIYGGQRGILAQLLELKAWRIVGRDLHLQGVIIFYVGKVERSRVHGCLHSIERGNCVLYLQGGGLHLGEWEELHSLQGELIDRDSECGVFSFKGQIHIEGGESSFQGGSFHEPGGISFSGEDGSGRWIWVQLEEGSSLKDLAS